MSNVSRNVVYRLAWPSRLPCLVYLLDRFIEYRHLRVPPHLDNLYTFASLKWSQRELVPYAHPHALQRDPPSLCETIAYKTYIKSQGNVCRDIILWTHSTHKTSEYSSSLSHCSYNMKKAILLFITLLLGSNCVLRFRLMMVQKLYIVLEVF